MPRAARGGPRGRQCPSERATLARKRQEVDAQVGELVGTWGTLWAPSTTTIAPGRGPGRPISCNGLNGAQNVRGVPTATTLVLATASVERRRGRSWRRSLSGTRRIRAPVSCGCTRCDWSVLDSVADLVAGLQVGAAP